MNQEITNLCNTILEHKKCNGCGGGEYETGCCIYCGNENKEINENVSKILELIDSVDINADLLLSLKSIDFADCKKIKDMLNQYDFGSYLKARFELINNKIKSNELSEMDIKYLYYYMDNGYYDKENIGYIAGFLMAKLMHKELELTLEEKLKFTKFFTETIISMVYPTIREPKCFIQDEKENVLGASFYKTISLDKSKTCKYLNDENYVMLLILIFHEATHCSQTFQMHSKDAIAVTYMNLLNAKEEIIHMKHKNYYDENYVKFSQEVEARYTSYEMTLKYIENKGMKLRKDGLEWIREQMQKDYLLLFDETRTLDGKQTTVDEVFESLEISYKEFVQYPVLSLQYKYVEGKLVRKTKEELETDYVTLNPSAEVDYLYERLTGNVETKVI